MHVLSMCKPWSGLDRLMHEVQWHERERDSRAVPVLVRVTRLKKSTGRVSSVDVGLKSDIR